MKLSRRIVSLLMALVMLFTMVSPVFAATTYEVLFSARCSELSVTNSAGVVTNLQSSNASYPIADTNAGTPIGTVLDFTDVTAVCDHLKANGTARQLTGWRIIVEGQNGHEYLDGNVYSTADILAMDIDSLDLPTAYVQFQLQWDDSEDNYHSNTDFGPYYGTVIRDNGNPFTAPCGTLTGGSRCEGDPVETNLSTDTTGYDGGVYGDFEGWVRTEWYEDQNGNFCLASVDTNSDNAYSFADILKDDPTDTDFHTVPGNHVAYYAKWSNIPYSDYHAIGADNNGTGNGQSFMQVEMYFGTADLTEPDGATTHTNDVFRQGMPDGTIFATRFGYLHNFNKQNASLEGFYRYDPTTDANGDVVYNIYTETDSNGDDVPVNYHPDIVNFAPVGPDDVIYVANWSDVDEDEYIDYHPIQQDGSQAPTSFRIGFDIYGGTAKHLPAGNTTPDDISGGPDGLVQLRTDIDLNTVFSSVHGSTFIYDMAFNGDATEFEGWLVYKFLPPVGAHVYTDSNLVTNLDAHGSSYHEDIIYVAKWKSVPLSDYENYVVAFEDDGSNPGAPQQPGTVKFNFGSADSIVIKYTDGTSHALADGSVLDSANSGIDAGKSFNDIGVESITATVNNTSANCRFEGWTVLGGNGDWAEFRGEDATQVLFNHYFTEGESVVTPIFTSIDVIVEFEGAELTVTSGDNNHTPSDAFGYPATYSSSITLKNDGYDAFSNPVFYTQRGAFLGWDVYPIYTPEDGPDELNPLYTRVPSADITSKVLPNDIFGVVIRAIWADADMHHTYFVYTVFDVLDGSAVLDRVPDDPNSGYVQNGVVVERNMRKQGTISSQLGVNYPVDIQKNGATFEGWVKIALGADGKYVLDQTLVPDATAKGTVPSVDTFYVAKWSDTAMSVYEEYVQNLNYEIASSISMYFVPNGGTLEISADEPDGTHFAERITGNYTGSLYPREGVSIEDEIVDSGITNFTMNLYLDEFNFAGWDVYVADEEDFEIVRVAEGTGYTPADPSHFVVYEGIDDVTQPGTILDVYTVYKSSTLVAQKISTETMLESAFDDSVMIFVAQWEAAPKQAVVTPEADPNDQLAVSIQNDVQVPENEAVQEKYESIEEVKDALEVKVEQKLGSDTEIVFMEIKLMVKEDGEGEWKPVDPENFPETGLEVVIPFPEGTGPEGFKFVIAHLISSGSKAGDIEILPYEITEEGLKVKVFSLSPFAVSFKEAGAGSGSTDVTARPNPSTGVHF